MKAEMFKIYLHSFHLYEESQKCLVLSWPWPYSYV